MTTGGCALAPLLSDRRRQPQARLSSKNYFQTELNLPRGSNGAENAARTRSQRQSCRCEKNGVRPSKIGVIQNIEELCAELNPALLPDRKQLINGKINAL